MKAKIIGLLKIVLPLLVGIYLVWYFYDALSPEQRDELFEAFRTADLKWLYLSMLFSWLSHVSRAHRWRYLLRPLGHNVGLVNAYHCVMVGYIMNLLLPRAGEASRAAFLYRYENVPFNKGFGTIVAERAIDLIMLGGIALVTLFLQFDKIDLIKDRIAQFQAGQGGAEEGGIWGIVFMIVVVLGAVVAAYLFITKPAFRSKLQGVIRGLGEGIKTVFSTKHKGAFLFHTFLIWGLYLLMFWVGFYCLPDTSVVSAGGILAGFLAGSLGIILVQGGIGVYPAFVALIVSIYMVPDAAGGLLLPQALAMGWLIWVAQTLLIIVAGGVSLLLITRQKRMNHGTSGRTSEV